MDDSRAQIRSKNVLYLFAVLKKCYERLQKFASKNCKNYKKLWRSSFSGNMLQIMVTIRLMSSGLVTRLLDYLPRGVMFEITRWLFGLLSLSFFQGWLIKFLECLETWLKVISPWNTWALSLKKTFENLHDFNGLWRYNYKELFFNFCSVFPLISIIVKYIHWIPKAVTLSLDVLKNSNKKRRGSF